MNLSKVRKPKGNKHFKETSKRRVAKAIVRGDFTRAEAAEKLGISYQTVARWVQVYGPKRTYQKRGKFTFKKDNDPVKTAIRRLEENIETLKAAQILLQ